LPATTRRLDGPLLACASALVVVALFRRLVPADSDTPWHLAEGKLLLRRWADGAWEIGRTDTFSWTARGASWHPNSWGFDVVLAVAYDLGGWLGVALLRVLLLGGIVALAWIFSRRSGAGRWARAGAVWISTILVIPTGAMRSQLVSFVFFLAVLEMTARILRCGGRLWPRLLALAVTISLWSTLHGAVIFGAAAVAAACAGHVLDTRTWRRPALATVVAFAASCASPLGVTVWTYALRTGGDSRRQGIQEWQPASIHRPGDVAVVLFLLLLLGWALWHVRSGRGEVRWSLIGPAVLATGLTFLATRNATFAVLAVVPLLAALITASGRELDRRGRILPIRPGAAIVAMTIGGLLAGAIDTGQLSLDPDPLDAPDYPAFAAAALPSGCRVLNEYHFGGYLILVRPDVPVSQDGRNDLYGTDRLQAQKGLFKDPDPASAPAALERLGITCVLAEPSRELLRALARDPRWQRAAHDTTAEAWIRLP